MDESILVSSDRGKVNPARATRLSCLNFRCFSEVDVSFAPSRNLFIGKNAQGKTSLVEAIYLIATTTSFRTAATRDVVRGGAPLARIALESADPPALLEMHIPLQCRRIAKLNGQAFPKISDLIGRFPTVAFTSQDLRLVTAEPSDRRNFLDQELSQLSPAYLTTLLRYRRALHQRNALLKEIQVAREADESLRVWDQRLADTGAEIRVRRLAFVEDLARFAEERHRHLSGGAERLSLSIITKDKSLEAGTLLHALERARPADIAAGTTTVGPHRDDVEILLDGDSAKKRGSQGQQRTAVLALKLALLDLWRERQGRLPVLLLDDIMSDLDLTRRKKVLELTGTIGQVFITSTELQSVSDLLDGESKVFTVEQGKVME